MKILVRSPNWIGDQILAYPFFHFLRRGFPRARITASCSPWTESVQFENLVDEVVVLPRPREQRLLARIQAMEAAASELRKRGPFDLAITLPSSFSSAWILRRSGARQRIGYAADGRGFLLTSALAWQPERLGHRSEAYVRLLPEQARPPGNFSVTDFWGVPPPPPESAGEGDEESAEPDPVIDAGVPSCAVLERFDPEKAWPSASALKSPLDGPYWVLAPGSTAESRRWPLENFANLARKISAETGLPGLVAGGPSEAPIAERLCADSELRLKDFTAQGPVSSLWRIFREARFTVSNDSGLAHVAALCGSQVQVIWGAGDPKRTEPLGPGRVRILFNPVDCWPCERNTCSQNAALKLQCIRGMDSDRVWEEMKRGLRLS